MNYNTLFELGQQVLTILLKLITFYSKNFKAIGHVPIRMAIHFI